MIFTARQLQEKCEEQNVDLYMTFVDYTAVNNSSIFHRWVIVMSLCCTFMKHIPEITFFFYFKRKLVIQFRKCK